MDSTFSTEFSTPRKVSFAMLKNTKIVYIKMKLCECWNGVRIAVEGLQDFRQQEHPRPGKSGTGMSFQEREYWEKSGDQSTR